MKHIAILLVMVAVFLPSCAPTPMSVPTSTVTASIIPSVTLTNTPEQTATFPATDTPRPAETATSKSSSGDPNDANRKKFLDSLKYFIEEYPLLKEDVDHVQSISIDNGVVEVDVVTTDLTKMGQQMQSYFILVSLGPELAKNPGKGLRGLG